jgi:asparagine synthase (glutamine-hydrolysing)
MCGIGGILATDGAPIPDAWADAIDRRIAYRGPDGEGRFHDRVEHERDGARRVTEVVLVHRRLSIIDHAGGGQPMVSPRGRDEGEGLVAAVFNGCLYNHRELRKELEGLGRSFTSDHSDTEVLLHGYREWGEALDERLEGMYAAAIWDRGGARLVLLRDWFGEKPLYLARGAGGRSGVTAFASDARAVAGIDGSFAGRIDPSWLPAYLQLGYGWRGHTPYACDGGDGPSPVVAAPLTVVERCDELMPTRPREAHAPGDFEDLLEGSVAARLEADVPLGCFLSGGVDSSLIAVFAQRLRPDLATFSVRMPDPRYDESDHAERVAAHLGTSHRTLDCAARPAEDLEHLVCTLGQPFGDSSILPTYWVSRAARTHVKVALSGDGGDELFFGYERYLAARHLVRHRRALRWLPAGWLARAHPTTRRHKLGRLGVMARDLDRCGLFAMESLFSCEQLAQLLGGPPPALPRAEWGFDPMLDLRRADVCHYLPGDLLTKVDTASMAVALEVRAPFLDRSLARAALAAPTWQLAPGGRRKGLLREVARKHLPADAVDRRKMGFAIPIGEWFANDFGGLRELLLDHLRSSDPFGPFHLERRAVDALVDEHLDGVRDHGQRLFALLTLAIWARSA